MRDSHDTKLPAKDLSAHEYHWKWVFKPFSQMNHVDGKPVKVGYLRNSAYTTMNNGSVRSGMAQEDLELLLCLNLLLHSTYPYINP